MQIPLEDNFNDIMGKAQRGLKITKDDLARKARVSVGEIDTVLSGQADEAVICKLAPCLQLNLPALLDSARQDWQPEPHHVEGLVQFTTPYHDMTVNAYAAWDPITKEAAIFDTGANATPILECIKNEGLTPKVILLTHTHVDHIADLDRLKSETAAPAYVCNREIFNDAEGFDESKTFTVGSLSIETRLTWGHSKGGITYVIEGLAKPVAVVGDAMFAGSMGGGMISYEDALRTNREEILSLPDETILCPGHGPLTTVGEEKRHNPFFPEFQK
jgi:glyoxylase-like metal-dependent hydrolase (beta-lactamase superfamily II)